MKKIYRICLIAMGILVSIVIIKKIDCTKLNKTNFLETGVNITREIPQELECEFQEVICKYFIEKNQNKYFSELKLSLCENAYSIYYLYFDYLLLLGIDGDVSLFYDNIDYITLAAEQALLCDDIESYDIVGTMCLQNMIKGFYEYEMMEYFLEKHYSNQIGLFFENVNDDIETKIAYTVDICRMFNMAGIEYNERIVLEIDKYYKQTRYTCEFEDNSIFDAGGDAIYAMSIVGNKIEISEELLDWFTKWKNIYSTDNVSSWEDVMELDCVYRPIAEIFGDTSYYRILNEYVSNYDNLQDFTSNFYEERLAYDLLCNHFDAFTEQDVYLISEKVLSCVSEHISAIETPSLEQTFYGMELLYCVDTTKYYSQEIWDTIIYYYASMVEYYMSIDGGIDIDFFARETYFFTVLEFQKGEGTLSDTALGLLSDASIVLSNNISNINDPTTLRMTCSVLSYSNTRVEKKTKDEIKNRFDSFAENENIVYSYYLVDLLDIQMVMGFKSISDERVNEYIACLWDENNHLYSAFLDNNIYNDQIMATYYILAYLMNYTGCSEVNIINRIDTDNYISKDLKTFYYINCINAVFDK